MTKRLLPALLLALFLAACGGSADPTPTLVLPTLAPTTAPAADNSAADNSDVVPTVAPTLPPPVVNADDGGGADAPNGTDDAMRAPLPAWPANSFGYGIQSHAVVGDPGDAMFVVGEQLGMNWVKVQMRWADVQTSPDSFDWSIWDSIVNEANENGLYLMFSIVTSPAWARAAGNQEGPPDDFNRYYDFVEMVLRRYPGNVHAVEVWNEQNIDREWNTAVGLEPANYVTFLKGTYERIKSIDPSVIVISGALSPTGNHDPNKIVSMDNFIYLDEALAAGMLDYTDCLGVHHNGYNLPPNVEFDQTLSYGTPDQFNFKGPFDNQHHSWSFASTLRFSAEKAQAIDPNMKLCVTEFGWPSSEGYDTYPAGFEFALDNTLEEQAMFITQAFQQMAASGDVMLAFLFNFDFGNKAGNPQDDNVPYSIVDINGVPRPAFGALAGLEKR